MKRKIASLLILSLLLCGCGTTESESSETKNTTPALSKNSSITEPNPANVCPYELMVNGDKYVYRGEAASREEIESFSSSEPLGKTVDNVGLDKTPEDELQTNFLPAGCEIYELIQENCELASSDGLDNEAICIRISDDYHSDDQYAKFFDNSESDDGSAYIVAHKNTNN